MRKRNPNDNRSGSRSDSSGSSALLKDNFLSLETTPFSAAKLFPAFLNNVHLCALVQCIASCAMACPARLHCNSKDSWYVTKVQRLLLQDTEGISK